MSPETLLDPVGSNNMEAFEEVYNRYWKNLYSFTYNKLRSKEIAEEIVQEFLTNLWANRKTFALKTSFRAYIYTAIRNLVLNHISKEVSKWEYSKFANLNNSDIDNITEQTVYIWDLSHCLERELTFLPDKCRFILKISRNGHKTNKEIAEELGISEKTVEGHLQRRSGDRE